MGWFNHHLEKLGKWTTWVYITVATTGASVAWTGFELFAMMNIITACFVDSVPFLLGEKNNGEVSGCMRFGSPWMNEWIGMAVKVVYDSI